MRRVALDEGHATEVVVRDRAQGGGGAFFGRSRRGRSSSATRRGRRGWRARAPRAGRRGCRAPWRGGRSGDRCRRRGSGRRGRRRCLRRRGRGGAARRRVDRGEGPGPAAALGGDRAVASTVRASGVGGRRRCTSRRGGGWPRGRRGAGPWPARRRRWRCPSLRRRRGRGARRGSRLGEARSPASGARAAARVEDELGQRAPGAHHVVDLAQPLPDLRVVRGDLTGPLQRGPRVAETVAPLAGLGQAERRGVDEPSPSSSGDQALGRARRRRPSCSTLSSSRAMARSAIRSRPSVRGEIA